jgi:sigma-B regulation protein RsbU (phosphoserine phosphatase)
MFTRQIRGGFATMFLCNYDGSTHTLRYACAGHPPPLVKRAGSDRICRMLDDATDIPLGVETEHEWQSAEAKVRAGDMLVLYTDGATEAESPAGKQFGEAGMRQAAERSTATDPAGLVADIVAALKAHAGSLDVGDDCTILVAQPE